jgi:hypothetical protein
LGAQLGDGVADVGKFVLWFGCGHLNDWRQRCVDG